MKIEDKSYLSMVSGKFIGEYDFRSFPFETLNLPIKIEPEPLSNDCNLIIDERTLISKLNKERVNGLNLINNPIIYVEEANKQEKEDKKYLDLQYGLPVASTTVVEIHPEGETCHIISTEYFSYLVDDYTSCDSFLHT